MRRYMPANSFFTWMKIKPWDFDLAFRLNNLLPDDIAVFDIIPMDGLPHARFDAIERSYDYLSTLIKIPS
jgi:tRNA pseudouridine38-40 synthase